MFLRNIIIVNFCLMLAACASSPKYQVNIELDIPGGEFEYFDIGTWDVTKSICSELTINRENKEKNWGTLGGLAFYNQEKNRSASVKLSSNNGDVTLLYKLWHAGREKNYSIDLKRNIKIGQPTFVKLRFLDAKSLIVESDGILKKFAIDFEPEHFTVTASSVDVTVRYSMGDCTYQAN